jgi:hypothetical protein
MTTCYGAGVEKRQRVTPEQKETLRRARERLEEKRRKLTEDEKEVLRRAQERLDRAKQELENAALDRDQLLRTLHDQGVGALAVCNELGLHRTTVQRIMTPGPHYRATRERKS